MGKKSQPRIWVLLDTAKGHQNQAIGVAEALGLPFETKKLVYNLQVRSPNWMKLPIFGLETLGVHCKASDSLKGSWPDLVIACGRKTAPVARYIKRKAGKYKDGEHKCKIVQIMWPVSSPKVFDLIAVPKHDVSVKYADKYANIIPILGAPHRITKLSLKKAKKESVDSLGAVIHPTIAVLVGGNTKRSSFKVQYARQLIQSACTLTSEPEGKLLISTSRRTPRKAITVIKEQLSWYSDNYIYYHPDDSSENPYMQFLAASDAIVVTGDSISMMSEACGTGKPVYIYMPSGYGMPKHERFVADLEANGYAEKLEENRLPDIIQLLKKGHKQKPLNSAQDIADEIRKRF